MLRIRYGSVTYPDGERNFLWIPPAAAIFRFPFSPATREIETPKIGTSFRPGLATSSLDVATTRGVKVIRGN